MTLAPILCPGGSRHVPRHGAEAVHVRLILPLQPGQAPRIAVAYLCRTFGCPMRHEEQLVGGSQRDLDDAMALHGLAREPEAQPASIGQTICFDGPSEPLTCGPSCRILKPGPPGFTATIHGAGCEQRSTATTPRPDDDWRPYG